MVTLGWQGEETTTISPFTISQETKSVKYRDVLRCGEAIRTGDNANRIYSALVNLHREKALRKIRAFTSAESLWKNLYFQIR